MQESKILNHSLSFFLGLLHHFLFFLLLAGNLSPYLATEQIHPLQTNPCHCRPSEPVSPLPPAPQPRINLAQKEKSNPKWQLPSSLPAW